ncbi:undecaprenyl-phosphate glucose phosphotransferase [bacterium]|nr:undecaprenyl-phosphate glucose phosphotransferase [bacterium]
MLKKHEITLFVFPLMTLIIDAVVIYISIIAAYLIRYSDMFYALLSPPQGIIPSFSQYLYSSIVFTVLILIFMAARGVYRERWRESFGQEIWEVLSSYYFGVALLFAMIFFYREFSYSRVVAIFSFIIATLLLIFVRALLFHFRKTFFFARSPHRVLIIGMDIDEISQRFSRSHQIGLKLVSELPLEHDEPIPGDLIERVKKDQITTILFSYGFGHFDRVREIIDRLEGNHINFLFAPDPKGLVVSNFRPLYLAGLPLLQLREEPFLGWNRVVKRTFDVVFSTLMLIFLLLPGIVISLLVKLTSRGPVFYSQKRIGLDGKEFTIYKFRSMRLDAETNSGPVWAKKGDDRTTALGAFLRRWSIDELPQLWNIIRGDMSVVGPRPERPYFVDQFKQEVPRYSERHRVLCGLTGWAQVNGLRGQVPVEERIKYDLYYIENWTLAFDIRIILRTIVTVLFGRNAY